MKLLFQVIKWKSSKMDVSHFVTKPFSFYLEAGKGRGGDRKSRKEGSRQEHFAWNKDEEGKKNLISRAEKLYLVAKCCKSF